MLVNTPMAVNENMALPSTMNAVVFDGPYKISLQKRPVPQSKLADARTTDTRMPTSKLTTNVPVQDGRDVVVKVNRTAVSNSRCCLVPRDKSALVGANADCGAIAVRLVSSPPGYCDAGQSLKRTPRAVSCMPIEAARCPSRGILWATSSRVKLLRLEPMSSPSRSVTRSYRLSRRPGKT